MFCTRCRHTLTRALPSLPPCPPQVSAFQKYVRGTTTRLYEHISKQMNELNMERCRCARVPVLSLVASPSARAG